MKKLSLWMLLWGVVAVSSWAFAGETVVPASRMEDPKWYAKRHNDKVAEMEKGEAKLLLVGDSITHQWEGGNRPELAGVPEVAEKYLAEFSPINLGFSGDRTQNVLWRLDNMPLDKIKPQGAMLMIGTNNINRNSSAEIADGVVEIIKRLQKQYPNLKILLLAIFPRGEKATDPLRAKVKDANAAIMAATKKIKNVAWLDIGDILTEKDGSLTKATFYDFLHPGTEGYERWGKAVQPQLKKMLKSK